MATSGWQQVETDGSIMRLHVSAPEGAGPFPALVVAQHQGGVDEFVQSMTNRLAGAGYVAAAPEIYHRDGPECSDDARTRSMRLQRPQRDCRYERGGCLLAAAQRRRPGAGRHHRILHGRPHRLLDGRGQPRD